jgi:hypothetical protein
MKKDELLTKEQFIQRRPLLLVKPWQVLENGLATLCK